MRSLFFEHGAHLALGRPVDAGIGPGFVPMQQPHVLLVGALETFALERTLHVMDSRFDLPFFVGCVRPARKRDHTVMRQHRGEQLVDLRVIDVRIDHAFFEIVRTNNPRRSAIISKRLFVQLAPQLL